MPSTIALLDLSDILLDQRNPRLDDTVKRNGQVGVIQDMMADKALGQQVYKLALDIVQYGMDPTALIAVIESEEDVRKYITLEGNRRIVALKILTNPEMIIGISKKSIVDGFKKLSKQFLLDPITEVNGVIFDDEEEANHWIKMRHTGQNEGAGLVEWNSVAQGRYASRKGDAPPEIQVIDFVRSHGSLSKNIQENLANFKITNLQRLLTTKDVRDIIGLTQTKGILYTKLPEDEIIKPLRKLIEDLSDNIKVKDLMTKRQRLEYMYSLPAEFMPDFKKEYDKEIKLSEVKNSDLTQDSSILARQSEAITNNGSSAASKESKSDEKLNQNNDAISGKGVLETKSQKSVPTTDNISGADKLAARELSGVRSQKTVIPASCRLKIPVARINELFKELKRLDATDFPNSSAVMLRVFLELSVDEYIKSHKWELPKKDQNLKGKIQKCLDYLIGNDLVSHTELQAVKNFTMDTSSLGSTVTLNAYVHNPLMHPDPMSLKITWNNMFPLVERIWS